MIFYKARPFLDLKFVLQSLTTPPLPKGADLSLHVLAIGASMTLHNQRITINTSSNPQNIRHDPALLIIRLSRISWTSAVFTIGLSFLLGSFRRFSEISGAPAPQCLSVESWCYRTVSSSQMLRS